MSVVMMTLMSSKNSDVLAVSEFENETSLRGRCDTESCLDWLRAGLVSSLLSVIKEGLMAVHFRPAKHYHVERLPASALGLLANLKKTCEVKGACQVEATSITTVVKE
jgi:hypothetical protein